VNVSGSFVLGVLFTVSTGAFDSSPHLRSALTVAFVGAYTMFSTFSLQTVRLIETVTPRSPPATSPPPSWPGWPRPGPAWRPAAPSPSPPDPGLAAGR
jgi:hypothetical protein